MSEPGKKKDMFDEMWDQLTPWDTVLIVGALCVIGGLGVLISSKIFFVVALGIFLGLFAQHKGGGDD